MFCVLVFFALLVIATVLTGLHQKVSALNNSFAAAAEELSGRFYKGGWTKKPVVTFVYAGLDAVLTVFKDMTYLRVKWPDKDLRCVVYPERPVRTANLRGLRDIQIGDAGFDRRFIINGPDEERVRSLLDPFVRQHIDRLYKFRGNNHVFVQFSGGVLGIKKRGISRGAYDMRRFLQLCIALVDSAFSASSDEIEFIDGPVGQKAAVTWAEDPHCQICGETVDGEAVYCRGCDTPHHRDCWEYYGSCSTYGCGQTRFRNQPKAS